MTFGISNGIGRFGVSGPPNRSAPAGGNPVTSNNTGVTKWYESGPLWVLIFLVVGWVLVYQTVK
jgi:hypothetical protein